MTPTCLHCSNRRDTYELHKLTRTFYRSNNEIKTECNLTSMIDWPQTTDKLSWICDQTLINVAFMLLSKKSNFERLLLNGKNNCVHFKISFWSVITQKNYKPFSLLARNQSSHQKWSRFFFNTSEILKSLHYNIY